MNTVSQLMSQYTNYSTTKAQDKSQISKASQKTVGEAQLSDKAQAYYKELQEKYSDLDFVLVDDASVEGAEEEAAKYANGNKIMVLVDEATIEKMAEDEEYRTQYEGIIENGVKQLDSMQNQFGNVASNVKTFGIRVNNDGTTSYFAVVDKSLAAQKERIQKNAEKKAEAKEAAEKKAEKKAEAEKLEEKRAEAAEKKEDLKKAEEKKAEEADKTSKTSKSENLETVCASSFEELLKKIQNTIYAGMSDNVQTEQEKMVGQNFDFSC